MKIKNIILIVPIYMILLSLYVLTMSIIFDKNISSDKGTLLFISTFLSITITGMIRVMSNN